MGRAIPGAMRVMSDRMGNALSRPSRCYERCTGEVASPFPKRGRASQVCACREARGAGSQNRRGGSGCAAGVEGVRWHSAGAVRSVDAGLGGKKQCMHFLGRACRGGWKVRASRCRRRCRLGGAGVSWSRHRSNKSRGTCGPKAPGVVTNGNVDDSMIMRYAAICEIPCGQIPCSRDRPLFR